MIYHVIWNVVSYAKPYSLKSEHASEVLVKEFPGPVTGKEMLAKAIKESKDCSFVFILVKSQGHLKDFDKWIEDYNLKDCIAYYNPSKGVVNPVHAYNGPNLVPVVMMSKDHFARDNKDVTE